MSNPTRVAAQKSNGSDSSQIIFVKNLPFKITGEDLYDIFTRYGSILQIRLGTAKEKKGTAFIVYKSVVEAKKAYEELNGFNVAGKYLICYFFKPKKIEQTLS